MRGLIKINPKFGVIDKEQVTLLIRNIECLFFEMTVINNNKGYINDPDFNLPIVHYFMKRFVSTLFKEDKKNNKNEVKLTLDEKYVNDVFTNKICYNLILILLYSILVRIEKGCIEKEIILDEDVKVDFNNVKKSILRMLQPAITNQIKNRGISITLNSIVGFDCEYELDSSLKNKNTLLSIQLAANSHVYLKIPSVDFPNKMSMKDFNLSGYVRWGNNKVLSVCFNSIKDSIKDIRSILYKDSDKMINDLCKKLTKLSKNQDSLIRIVDPEGDYELFSFPKTEVVTLIKYLDTYTSEELIKDSESLKDQDHTNSLKGIFNILDEVSGNNTEISDKMSKSIERSSNKASSRISYKYNNSQSQLQVSVSRVLYLCMHESSADLSMLKDFDSFKELLDITSRAFVTRGKPLRLKYSKSKVYIRDTILIAPVGVKSLSSVGSIYGEGFNKIDIGSYRSGNMSLLLEENKELFERYAIRDAEITLKHASEMESFNLSVIKTGVPLTISGIGKNYVLKEWINKKYRGYQIRSDLFVGNLMSKITPKDARAVDLTRYIVPFIIGYRGGRNETFMYGVDTIKDNENRQWIDYDLTSCYTTIMSLLGHPVYKEAFRLYHKSVLEMSDFDLLLNYVILDVTFEFPEGTKYPSIPTRVDDDVDIYPLKGRSTITGVEYLVAKNIGCKLYVKDGIIIPFERSIVVTGSEIFEAERKGIPIPKPRVGDTSKVIGCQYEYTVPFRGIVKDLQAKRRKYPKKTFYNYMYKEIGNSIYGQVAMGVSGKTNYDIKTKTYTRIEGGILSNPILSSYITGFSRALLGECLNNIQSLGGSVVSVTTDGFITDIDDLENKLLVLEESKIKCLLAYRKMRELLTLNEGKSVKEALEIKHIEKSGLISWKTRGQLGYTERGITAATGFQSKFLNKSFLLEEWSRIMDDNNNEKRSFEFIQSSLRSASDIYKKGGHVLQVFKDRRFSLDYDNKRRITEDKFPNFKDSLPWKCIQHYGKVRVLEDTIKTPVFTGYSTQPSKSYRSYIETSVRAFIRACVSDIEIKRYGIPKDMFKSYKSIIEFIHGYGPAKEVRITLSSISHLKSRNSISRAVPRNKENEGFIEYVQNKIVTFNSDLFFRELSDESIKNLKSNKK